MVTLEALLRTTLVHVVLPPRQQLVIVEKPRPRRLDRREVQASLARLLATFRAIHWAVNQAPPNAPYIEALCYDLSTRQDMRILEQLCAAS